METAETGETVETRELPFLMEGYQADGAFHLALGYGAVTQRFVLANRELRPEGAFLPFRALHVAQWGECVAFVAPSGIHFERPRAAFVPFASPVQLAASAGAWLATASLARLEVFALMERCEASLRCEAPLGEEISALAAWTQGDALLVAAGEWIAGRVTVLRFENGAETGSRVEIPLASTAKSLLFVEQAGQLLLLASLITGEVAILQLRSDAWTLVKQVGAPRRSEA